MNISILIDIALRIAICTCFLLIVILSFPNALNTRLISFINRYLEPLGNKKQLLLLKIISIVLAISIILIPGHMEGHDYMFHIARINGLAQGIKNGEFPVLVYPEYFNNYGYANGIFYPDIFLYIPALLVVFGVPIFTAHKVFLLLIILGSYWSIYFCCHKITKSDFVSSIIGLIYSTSSYFLIDLYTRSALGEAQAFVFFPLVVYGFYSIVYGDANDGKFFTLGIIGIVFCHVLSVFICVLLVFAFAVANIKPLINDRKRLLNLIIYGLFSIGITLFIILPMAEMMTSDSYLFNISRGHSPGDRAVPLFFTILEVSYHELHLTFKYTPQGIGIVFVYLLFMTRKYYFEEKKERFSIKTLLIGLLFLFMATDLFPWNVFYKVIGVIQFPWRFYICVTICLLFAFMNPLRKEYCDADNKKKISLAVIICMFSIITISLTLDNLFDVYYNRSNDVYFDVMGGEYIPTDCVDLSNVDELGKIKFDTDERNEIQLISKNRGQVITSNNDDMVFRFERKGTDFTITYENNQKNGTYLELPLIYYKGYKAIENNNPLLVEKGTDGLLRVNLNNQEGTINVFYGFTNIRICGMILSSISLLVFIIYIIKQKPHRCKNEVIGY